jgi:PAS domain S-box-containing protein
MTVQRRNHVQVSGSGSATIFFAHGFGCDQTMWRFIEPVYAGRFRTVKFDLVGAGLSDLAAYDRKKYSSLQGYADDVLEIIKEFGQGPAIFIGHSVSAMIGMLADLKEPGLIAAQVMVSPSPCYLNDGDYVGGFEREDIDSLLELIQSNYLGWSSKMAPAIMGAPEKPELGIELTNSFCRTNPDIAKQFGRVTFLADNRKELPLLNTPTLILQCSEDLIAPIAVGEYMSRVLPHGTLKIIRNTGHCPHMSEPAACIAAIDEFLADEGFAAVPASTGASDDSSPELVALFDEAACGLVQTDMNGRFLHANQVFCNWLGYCSKELIGIRHIADLFTTGGRVFHQTHSIPLLQMQGSICEVRMAVLHKEGHLVPMIMNALQHRKGEALVHEWAFFIARDRDNYEQELIQSRNRLEVMIDDVTRLEAEAKDRAVFAEQMVGIVSHDLRNPISAILMGAELLRRAGITANQSHVLGRMAKAGNRANRLIDGLLDFTQARMGRGLTVSLKTIDLHAVVSEAVDELSQAFPARKLQHVQQGERTSCLADADRLTQMIGNLVANAMTYGDANWPVTVTSAITDECFSISVHNEGAPIPQSAREGLFRPLVRGSSDATAGHSVGLGLYIVSEIAKAHGGRVAVESSLEAGTVFTAVFPHRT